MTIYIQYTDETGQELWRTTAEPIIAAQTLRAIQSAENLTLVDWHSDRPSESVAVLRIRDTSCRPS